MTKNTVNYLEALSTGDPTQIDAIYRTNFPNVKRFILQNKGQLADAEDIFQKALIQITVRYKKAPFTINSNFEAYVFTVCKNLWRRELNKQKKWVTTDQLVQHKDEDEDIARSIIEQKRWELFNDNLKLLSENCRKVMSLFFAKVSYADIVKTMNYNSETVVRQRVFKCKAKLKELVQKDKRFNALKYV